MAAKKVNPMAKPAVKGKPLAKKAEDASTEMAPKKPMAQKKSNLAKGAKKVKNKMKEA